MASVTGLSKIGLPHLSENMDAEDARPSATTYTRCRSNYNMCSAIWTWKICRNPAHPAEQHPVRKEKL